MSKHMWNDPSLMLYDIANQTWSYNGRTAEVQRDCDSSWMLTDVMEFVGEENKFSFILYTFLIHIPVTKLIQDPKGSTRFSYLFSVLFYVFFFFFLLGMKFTNVYNKQGIFNYLETYLTNLNAPKQS